MKVKTIECYNFPEFCEKIQSAINEGYEFDFESNERYPTSFGGYYNVILVNKSENTQDSTEEVSKPRGRKPKSE